MKTIFGLLVGIVLSSQIALARSPIMDSTRVSARAILVLEAEWRTKSVLEFIELIDAVEASTNKNAAKQSFYCGVKIDKPLDFETKLVVNLELNCASQPAHQEMKLDVPALLKDVADELGVKVYEDKPQPSRGGATVHN